MKHKSLLVYVPCLEGGYEDAGRVDLAGYTLISDERLYNLEAAEKETASWKGLAKQFGNEADALRSELSKQQALTDAAQHIAEVAQSRANQLQAKITKMEQQEPYAFAVNFPETSRVELVRDLDEVYEDLIYEAHEVRKLYTLPGAQGEEN